MRHGAGGDRVVLHAEVRHADRPVAAEVGDERIVGVEHELRRRGRGDGRRPAVGDRLELAVAVELVAEEVGQQQRARRAAPGRRWSSQNSSTSKSPASPSMPSPRAAPSSALATPPAMFAPARLCTRRAPERSRIAATIAAVVVLPFVAEMTALPCGRRCARRSIAAGLHAHEQLARQARAAAAAAPRQRAGGARDGDLRGRASCRHQHPQRARDDRGSWPAWRRSGRRRRRRRTGGRRRRAARGRAGCATAGCRTCAPREDPWQRDEEAALGVLGDQHDVEQAVVELRAGARRIPPP